MFSISPGSSQEVPTILREVPKQLLPVCLIKPYPVPWKYLWGSVELSPPKKFPRSFSENVLKEFPGRYPKEFRELGYRSSSPSSPTIPQEMSLKIPKSIQILKLWNSLAKSLNPWGSVGLKGKFPLKIPQGSSLSSVKCSWKYPKSFESFVESWQLWQLWQLC
jgi:hypothetical protein